jgi:hypothetical protein
MTARSAQGLFGGEWASALMEPTPEGGAGARRVDERLDEYARVLHRCFREVRGGGADVFVRAGGVRGDEGWLILLLLLPVGSRFEKIRIRSNPPEESKSTDPAC